MADVSELFESYEQEYTTLSIAISKKLNAVIPGQVGEERKASIRATERELEEADEIVEQMEMEVFNLPQASRTRFQARLRGYKSELGNLKRDLKRISSSSGEREELLLGHTTLDLDSVSMDQRARLLSGTERLSDSSRRLQDSHRLALETESVGVGILNDLRGQREQIQHTRDTLFAADSSIDRAGRTLKTMTRRMMTNRLLTAAIVIVLVLIIGFIVYMKFFH
ncbi:V-snare-domain-containing protein [Basidiobolus meristosporus CBS 931.73]|uniref:V-snare-domain-containing protein n=1 Tax=Basidiobolus meristosporus CBS 931.73 TaxID=1314790 RepID=A0A1Y1Z6T5_9FUNG|nr:V-snare-domain-containing protein [Basidiobolus meristosporus CBS 931.73]|eukprot:ORY05844.1 V-snare-domain-containing protein [Basidiobolus meristosporus CBS 931.73]